MIVQNGPDQAKEALKHARFFPFWLDSTDSPPSTPSLDTEIQCELLIVGAGFTGLWAAIHAKEENPERDVVIIEAKTAAVGASGRPAAILSTSVMHGLSNAKRLYPEDIDRLELLGKENIDGFKRAIEQYRIDCDLEWTGELTVAVGEQGLPDILREHQLYERYGHQAELLSSEELEKEIRSPLFSGGLWSKKRSGIVNPAKLAWGLRRVALSLGVRLYENTPLIASKRLAKCLQVTTPTGKVTATKVLLATNAFAAGHSRIRRRVAAIRDRIVVTEPLNETQMESIGWKHRQGIYDTRTQLNYMRLTSDNRILFGGRLGYFFNNNTDPDQDKHADAYLPLVENFYRTFPTLSGIKFSHAWSGPIGLTTRMAVHFQRYHFGNTIYAGGYSGFGVTASRFGAKVGLAILDGKDTEEAKMHFSNSLPGYIPPEPFRWIGAKITMYALDTADEKGGWRHWWIKMVEKMGFPVTQNELG
ncbi:FAD-dependent oxidoreductase [Veronia nyctiphanis]|uniref:FAD-dependent oxidoreductase n=1 Tax=Veronia nyctiphanis TaxID=1278244 RepID=A0A4Q0YRR6_9GAMM|nr:FAD-dependent oxidoreductase [Veronia nyctiphanis]RXJ73816.1 FAD-dependent oxidoreductase [Veronia nyctiphanis]